MKFEEIVEHILAHKRSTTNEEIIEAIEKKKAASRGFLTNEAAARLVAAEYGVKIERETQSPKIFIRQLVPGLNDVTVSGRVLLVDLPQVFPRTTENGYVAKLLIFDKTGSIKVVLWNDKAELANKIQPKQIVKALHGYVRQSRNGEMEIHIGQRGDIQIAPSDAKESDFSLVGDFFEKIHNIREGHKKVNVEGTVRTTYPVSSFQRRDGTHGKVMRIVIMDETGQIPVVLWDRKAEEIAFAKEGITISLINAKVKRNRKDGRLELHVGSFANVEISTGPKNLLHIKDLKEGMKVAIIRGIVATKPMLREVTTKEGEKIPVASFELKDMTGKAWVSVWRRHAEKIENLAVGAKIGLKNVCVRKGFGEHLEITTHSSTEIEVEQ